MFFRHPSSLAVQLAAKNDKFGSPETHVINALAL